MTEATGAHVELRVLVQRAEDKSPGIAASHGDLEDFRTSVAADLMDALDRMEVGLGTRLMLALYPRSLNDATDFQMAAALRSAS